MPHLALERDYRSRQIMAAIVVNSLHNALEEGRLPCEFSVVTALFLFIPENSNVMPGKFASDPGEYTDDLRKGHPEVIRACTHFLMAPRTTQQMHALALSPDVPQGQCACDMTNKITRKLHVDGRELISDRSTQKTSLLRRIIEMLLRTLAVTSSALGNRNGCALWKATKSAQRAQRCGKRGYWPTGILDVTPFGVEESIISICNWAAYYPHADLLDSVQIIYTFLSYSALPYILIHTIMPRLVAPVLKDLVLTWKDVTNSNSLPDMRTPCYHAYTSCANLFNIMLGLDRTHLAYTLSTSRSDDWPRIADLCVKAAVIINGVNTNGARRDERLTQMEKIFRYSAASLQMLFGMPATVMVSGQQNAAAVIADRETDAIFRLSRFSPYIYLPRVCANAECSQVHGLNGCELQKCSACRGVYYCSRECQKIGWHFQPAPHKQICNQLRTINDLVSISPRACRDAGFEIVNVFQGLCRAEESLDAGTVSDVYYNLQRLYSKTVHT